jgi:hypothetical protein
MFAGLLGRRLECKFCLQLRCALSESVQLVIHKPKLGRKHIIDSCLHSNKIAKYTNIYKLYWYELWAFG